MSNVYFNASRTAAILKEMRAQYEPYVPDSLRRFGPQWVVWNPEEHYSSNLNNLNKFFQRRNSTFLDVVKTALDLENPIAITIKIKDAKKGEVYINGREVPVTNNARIRVFAEAGLTVSAVPAEGATFKGWEVSHETAVLADPAALTTEVTFSRVFTLTAVFE